MAESVECDNSENVETDKTSSVVIDRTLDFDTNISQSLSLEGSVVSWLFWCWEKIFILYYFWYVFTVT